VASGAEPQATRPMESSAPSATGMSFNENS
jgi:hypothetical protein